MKATGLSVDRRELLRVLDVVGALRKPRAVTMPITLAHSRGELLVQKAGRWKPVSCAIPARGSWVRFGVTVDLLFLRDAVRQSRLEQITLHVLEDVIIVPLSETMHARLRLIDFELEPAPALPIASELPLFRWAKMRERLVRHG